MVLGLLTQGTKVAQRTDAVELAHHVHTFPAIPAGRGGALVNVYLAVPTRVSRGTGAPIVVDQVDATRSVPALAHAVVQVLGACGSAPALQANAGEGPRQIATLQRINAGSDGGSGHCGGCGGRHRTGQGGQKLRAGQVAANDSSRRSGQQGVGLESGGMGSLALIDVLLADVAAPLGRALAAKAAD